MSQEAIRILVRGTKNCGKTSLCSAIFEVASDERETEASVRGGAFAFRSFLVKEALLEKVQIGEEDGERCGFETRSLLLEIIDTAGFDSVPTPLPSSMTRAVDAVFYLVPLDPREVKASNAASWCRLAHEQTYGDSAESPPPHWLVGTKFDLLKTNKDFQNYKKLRSAATEDDFSPHPGNAAKTNDETEDERIYFEYLEDASKTFCEVRGFCADCRVLVGSDRLSFERFEEPRTWGCSICATSAITRHGVRDLVLQVLNEVRSVRASKATDVPCGSWERRRNSTSGARSSFVRRAELENPGVENSSQKYCYQERDPRGLEKACCSDG